MLRKPKHKGKARQVVACCGLKRGGRSLAHPTLLGTARTGAGNSPVGKNLRETAGQDEDDGITQRLEARVAVGAGPQAILAVGRHAAPASPLGVGSHACRVAVGHNLRHRKGRGGGAHTMSDRKVMRACRQAGKALPGNSPMPTPREQAMMKRLRRLRCSLAIICGWSSKTGMNI